MNIEFNGKSAIVTGSGSGLGKAIATQFAENGANVWIGDVVENNGLATLEELKKFGNSYGFTKADISKKDEMRKMFDDAKAKFGKIDIVVNAAGVFMPKHFLDALPEDIEKHLGINLMGAVYGCQLALETFISQGGGGKIVNISSVGGRRGELSFPFYALGKAGVLNLTQSVAYNGAKHNVNVNAVCPGIIRTPMWNGILKAVSGGDENVDTDALFNDILKARCPLGRAQTENDIAYTVLFLCSKYASEVTGQAWNVCGGDAMN